MSASSSTAATTITRANAHALSYYSPSSQSSPFSDSSDVDRDGFLQSQQRAGGPYLCSLPAYSVAITTEVCRRTGYEGDGQISETAKAILNEERLVYKNIRFTGRLSKVDTEPDPVPTVLVTTEQCSRPIAKRIQRTLASSFSGISVELITEAARAPYRCFPVTRAASIFHKWGDIVQAILSECDISEWTSVECWHYGTGRSAAENPITVVVGVLKNSRNRFYTSTQRIKGILARFDEGGVHILFQRNEIKRHSEDPLLMSDACTLRVQPGVSLGIHSSSAASSTLGGMVQLRFSNGPWQTYGLTNFHCVWAPPNHRQTLSRIQGTDQAFRSWMWSPVRPGDAMANELLKVDHPSVSDLRRTLDNLESVLAEYADAQYRSIARHIESREREPVSEEEQRIYDRKKPAVKSMTRDRDHIRNFLKNGSHFLGSVFAGSGLYRQAVRGGNKHYHLDWALINIPQQRLGPNKPFLYGNALMPPICSFDEGSFHQAVNDERVILKCGRSTAITRAVFSELECIHICRVEDPDHPGQVRIITSWEYVFAGTSRGCVFASPSGGSLIEGGDSGSFASTEHGGVIGLLWGGAELNDVGYVTPIEDIFEDIKVVTGASDVRIAP